MLMMHVVRRRNGSTTNGDVSRVPLCVFIQISVKIKIPILFFGMARCIHIHPE
jgi:hypothetical protein